MKIICVALILCAIAVGVVAHNDAPLSKLGGHYNEECGNYHFHKNGAFPKDRELVEGDYVRPLHEQKHPHEWWAWVPAEKLPDEIVGPWVYTFVSTRNRLTGEHFPSDDWRSIRRDAIAFHTDGSITEEEIAKNGAQLDGGAFKGQTLTWDIDFLDSGRDSSRNIHHLAQDSDIGDTATSYFYGIFLFESDTEGIADLFFSYSSTAQLWLNGQEVYRSGGCNGWEPSPDRGTVFASEGDNLTQIRIQDGLNRLLVKVGRAHGEGPYWQFHFGMTPHNEATEISVPVVYKQGRVQTQLLVTTWSLFKSKL